MTKMNTAILDEFWSEVEKIKWAKNADADKIKARLLREWSPEKAGRMREAFSYIKHQLYVRLDKVVQSCGDDGFDDLLSHIIGMGRDVYNANMEDPSLAQQRLRRGDVSESFAYCIPYEGDFKMRDPKVYQERAERVRDALKALTQDKRAACPLCHQNPPTLEKKTQDQIEEVVVLLNLVLDGDFKRFLQAKKQIIALMNELKPVTSPWPVLNLLKDMGNYLE